MSFLQRLRLSLARFMQNRHGTDNLGIFTLFAGLFFSLAGSFSGIIPLSFIGLILYVVTLFRMFSRNHEKRMAENRKYIELTSGWKTKIRQFFRRIKNRREYRYFRCPECRLLLRTKRSSGQKEIICVRCGHPVKKKF